MKYYDRSKTEFGLPPEEFPREKEYDAPVMEESFDRFPDHAPEDTIPAPEITEPGSFTVSASEKKKDSKNFRFMAYPYCAVALLTIFIGIGPIKNAFFNMGGKSAAAESSSSSDSSSSSSSGDETPADAVKTDIGLKIYSAELDDDEVTYTYYYTMSEVSFPVSVYAKVVDEDGNEAEPLVNPDIWDSSRAMFPDTIDVSDLDGDMKLVIRAEFEKDGKKYYSTAKADVSTGSTATDTPTPTPTPAEDEGGEKADDAFPILSNLEPNGPAPLFDFTNGGYAYDENGNIARGVYDEEYVRVNSNNDYLHAGKAYTSSGISESVVPGASYNKATNTLTLNNYSGDMLNVNLMGNGFTVELIGDNTLDCIVVWGWMYGGSIKFTGSGSLTINNNDTTVNNGFGIFMEAEASQTCIMVDSDVTLDVSGVNGAVMVYQTTMEKGIYYLNPLKLTGGERMGAGPLDDALGPDGEALYNYTIVDEDENPAKHVRFAK
ncbi:MAG: hypothetical protein IKR27_00835 [Lachnospiraceae bacterium]|nr:hypothetical protein [Lachnospiraceae bacterium]